MHCVYDDCVFVNRVVIAESTSAQTPSEQNPDLLHVKLKVSFLSCMLLHQDPAPTQDGLGQGQIQPSLTFLRLVICQQKSYVFMIKFRRHDVQQTAEYVDEILRSHLRHQPAHCRSRSDVSSQPVRKSVSLRPHQVDTCCTPAFTPPALVSNHCRNSDDLQYSR